MNKPCEHCDRAEKSRMEYFKCDKPCQRAKQCYENDKKLMDIFRGFMPQKLEFPGVPGEGRRMNKICCFLTGGHRFKSGNTKSCCDDKNKTCTITDTCHKCGKKFSFTATYKQFGIPD